MPSETLNLETRLKTLKAVLTNKNEQQIVAKALRAAKGNIPEALASLKDKLPEAALQTVALAHSLAILSDDHVSLVKALSTKSDLTKLRDVALHFDIEKLTALVDPKAVPENIAGATAYEKKRNFAIALQNKLFTAEPTAVLQRMVQDAEVPIADAKHRKGVVNFLANQPDFNIRTTSIYTALKDSKAFKGIADEHRAGVVEQLKTLQRVQAISPVPAAVPVLMKANLTSAFRVAEIPESTFLSAHGPALGEETARQVYTSAINTHIRNEHALMTMRESVRGTGLAIIDGQQPKEARLAAMQAVADQHAPQLNLETLFGSIDYCECDDCLSVYSPASYFVELLQYLRNNDLDPAKTNTGQKGIDGTPLEKLFRRRPDLRCLELTCENTFTVLPYIDLVNEVMESFVVHLSDYIKDPNIPKWTKLEVFNVLDETTSELLAQPQHVNYQAYCILKDAVHPFTLPYHQPIDAIRIWLKYMGTSRYELLDTFRTATETCDHVVLTADQQQQVQKLHSMVLDHSADAEFLGITQEEYIILTREAFWPKAYFDLTLQKVHTDDEYQTKIGVRPAPEYYGYVSDVESEAKDEMLSTNEKLKIGLTFVKKQFLPRTGIQYVDLVELLKTRFINPAFPQGKALTILESIRFSYRLLQKLVDPDTTKSPQVRFAKLIDLLNNPQTLVPNIDALLHPDLCHLQNPEHCLPHTDFSNWVYCYFERIGELIVLESREGPQLPVEGKLFVDDQFVGSLDRDGTFTSSVDGSIGHVDFAGQLIGEDGIAIVFKPFAALKDPAGHDIGGVDDEGFLFDESFEAPLKLLPPRDTCNLDKVRLLHLDGSPLEICEYDRMQRFIRLWHKLGWTIDETDHALMGLSASPVGGTDGGTTSPGDCNFVGYDTFHDECNEAGNGDGECSDGNGDDNCPDIPTTPENISTGFLHQLVAIRKLLDLTGLSLDKLLSFWADIGTSGETSLYARLFLTHNLLGIDKVFKSDANGNYLTQGAKMSEHMPVLLAALKLKTDDVGAIIKLRKLSDALTPANVSALYRHSLLAKILHVYLADLPKIFGLLGDPFLSPDHALNLLESWGEMEDAGFDFRQLSFLIENPNDPNDPVAPTLRTILQVSKTLYDGLNAIDRDHPNITKENEDDATADLIRAEAGLLYEASVVEQIINLLEGTSVYTTSAPLDLVITLLDTDPLAKKVKYTNQPEAKPVPTASLQVTGILSDAEQTQAKALSSDTEWSNAIDRAGKKARQFFDDKLSGIFPDKDDAKASLLKGDVHIEPDPKNSSATKADTAPDKRLYFLQFFIPFLRQRLAHQLIVTTMSGASGLPSDVTDVLLIDILLGDTPGEHAIAALEQIHQKPATGSKDWKGYLIPTTDDAYTFLAPSLPGETHAPPPLLIDGQSIPFKVQQEEPSNVWSTDPEEPLKLKSGKLYFLEVHGQAVEGLQWKTPSAPTAYIPTSALLPDYSSTGTKEVFIKLFKTALLVNGFGLSADEVSYWQKRGNDFASDGKTFDFNAVTLGHWRRLQAYTSLRNELPKTESSLLALFTWASRPGDATKLSGKIAAATLWKKEDIEKLIAPQHFDLRHRKSFRNEIALVKLQNALRVANAIGTDINLLFVWANPVSKFSTCHQIAEAIRASLRARYDQEDWEQVVKPLNDQLREDQKQALISYLLVQPDLIDWGVVDADSLFEFFLIDVQMDACMETSRIKQAISTVQLFVQRCLLGLEDKKDENGKPIGVSSDALDRDRWEWMQKYRVWEANRKIFLYPENWIKSELRDDKSPFYKELESELLQKDINTKTVEDALKSYLFKVDEVANLRVIGLFLEKGVKLHVFARTRIVPYTLHYRYFVIAENNWYAWEKMQVDVPSYDQENPDGTIEENGTFLIPVVWNHRLLVFLPQFTKKTAGQPASSTTFWEIKMAWSEYRNGKWMQKQVSSDAVYQGPVSTGLPNIREHRFIARLFSAADSGIVIDVHSPGNIIGEFRFAGSQLMKGDTFGQVKSNTFKTDFHYNTKGPTRIHSLQAIDSHSPSFSTVEPYFEDNIRTTNITVTKGGKVLDFYHPFSHKLLGFLGADTLDGVFSFYAGLSESGAPAMTDAFGGTGTTGTQPYHELRRAYSLYNWEAGFHVPMLLADRSLAAQQFDQALTMCAYVLNPYATGINDNRFWQFPPFKEVDARDALENLFLNLQANQPDNTPGQAITEWRNHPFQPHAVARSRPSAYMKWVVMKYIEILIAYGDYYFRQNTLETIPLAIQCYVLASHIYGPRGQEIPKRGKTLSQTYNSLLDMWDAFGNAMVELELVFPFSNQTPLPIGESNGQAGLANVFGFATTLYFCIPDNPQLRALRDTIDDRLFKIRHCQDIEGVVRHLPLFEPAIDPALLVQAAAQGLSLSSVLNDLNSPMPNYRFYYLLQKALELCSEVKALGNSFLSAKEKGEAEALGQLRARHESSIHNLVMEVKKQQLDEAGKALDALQQSRKGPVYRLQHYLKLIGEDLSKVPDSNTDFGELPDQIEQPVDESGLKLIQYEKEEMDKAAEANDKQEDIGRLEAAANILHAIPNFDIPSLPLKFTFGGSNVGSAMQAVARANQVVVGNRTFSSTNAGRKASFLRQLQDRVQQANTAGYEIKNIDKQILTQQIRINIAEQEITNQQKQIDNAQEMEDFLRNKYTNQELYSWMDSQIRTLYHQAYNLAYDLAKRAEKVFRFERGLDAPNIIQYGYWDAAYDGLFSGERLYIGLKQLEAAYQEKRGHDFEVSKSISLRQINPLALLQLKETGTCEFALPEVLFDMDYPGHYLRRLKSVSLRIPCILGPHTSLNCTLRLLGHKFRMNSIATNKSDYLEQTDEHFSTVNVPISSIAVSSLEDENGVFELNFHDERYLPFEGAGAISKWRLELPDPKKFKQFDYDTITDVVMRLRYTSVDGGDKLKGPATDSVQEYIKSVEDLRQEEGLFAVFDLKNDFPNEWYSANHPPQGATERILTIEKLNEKLPIFTKGRDAKKIVAKDIYLYIPDSLSVSITATQGGNNISFGPGKTVGTMKSLVSNDEAPMSDLHITIHDTATVIERMWLLERYVLTGDK
jgi:Tc toxin complex TcA C-terminal TcB-binding domain/Neuraminidase-like domain/Salmonella virulence plasmid 28.1kDa A protein